MCFVEFFVSNVANCCVCSFQKKHPLIGIKKVIYFWLLINNICVRVSGRYSHQNTRKHELCCPVQSVASIYIHGNRVENARSS